MVRDSRVNGFIIVEHVYRLVQEIRNSNGDKFFLDKPIDVMKM